MRKLVIFLLLLVVVLAAAGYLSSGYIAKTAIEKIAGRVLSTGVEVSSVDISPLGGSVTIHGLKVQNPQGFYGKYAIEVGSISAEISGLSALFSNPLVIQKVAVQEALLNFEMGINGNNIYTLQGNANRYSRSVSEKDLTPNGERSLVIKTLEISQPKLAISAADSKNPEAKGLEVAMGDVVVNGIGEASKPASIASALASVLKEVLVKMPLIDRTAIRDSMRNAGSAVGTVGDAVGGAVGGAVDGLRNMLGTEQKQ